MNHLNAFERLDNRYFTMRHGHSLANRQGIIVSHPENGLGGFGLSERGREQAGNNLRQATGLDGDTLIVSSDFRRALETAAIVHRLLGCVAPIETDARLRERNFGALELGPDNAYDAVWRQDALDADSRFRAAESANQVMERVTALVRDLEQRHADKTWLLVSHGDALQILQTAFARRNASEHRELQHLQTAEIRSLRLQSR